MNLKCRYYQFQLENILENGQAPSGRLQRHLRACNCCFGHYHDQKALIGSLREQAMRQQEPHVPNLVPYVMKNVRDLSAEDRATELKQPESHWAGWAVPAATVCLVFAMVSMIHRSSLTEQPKVEKAPWLGLSTAALVQQTTGQSVRQWGQQLDQPLLEEWQLLKQHAVVASDGLAETFLPGKFYTLYKASDESQR
ncbi:MAG: hypothetical protein P8L18_02350 [Verrucomicrobiota bacterium]|nr:hypothetical protein [Verrucomicrobiota bacterium]